MPIPTAYTEHELALFMHNELGEMAGVIRATAPDENDEDELGSYGERVIDVLLAYGVSDIIVATDIPKLRALARREAWRFAVRQLSSKVSFSLDGQSISLSDLQEQARESLYLAEEACGPVEGYVITRGQLRQWDPYRYQPEDGS